VFEAGQADTDDPSCTPVQWVQGCHANAWSATPISN